MPKSQAEVFALLINEAELTNNDTFELFLADNSEAFTINDASENSAPEGSDPFEDPITYTFSDGSRAVIKRKPDESDDGTDQDNPLIAEVLADVD